MGWKLNDIEGEEISYFLFYQDLRQQFIGEITDEKMSKMRQKWWKVWQNVKNVKNVQDSGKIIPVAAYKRRNNSLYGSLRQGRHHTQGTITLYTLEAWYKEFVLSGKFYIMRLLPINKRTVQHFFLRETGNDQVMPYEIEIAA